ncbi:AMP-binding protein, partial [Sutcliffiella horikoshii]
MNKGKNTYPLTHPQKRIYFTELLNYGSSVNNVCALIKIHHEVNYNLLNKAINEMINENNNFCIKLKKQNGQDEPVQYFTEHKERSFDYLDFSSDIDSLKLDEWLNYKSQEPFELFNSDLYYFCLIKTGESETIIYSKFHHIIFDGLSFANMEKQLAYKYRCLSEGIEYSNNLKSDYEIFIKNEDRYLNSQRFIADGDFWEEEFRSIPLITGIKSYNPLITSTESLRETFVVEENLHSMLKKFSRNYDFSIYTIFVACLQLSIHRWVSSDDVTIGMAYGNRGGKNEKELMGMMVSTVPFRMNIDDEEGILNFLNQVAKKQMKILRHQKYPFNLLTEKIRKNSDCFDRFFGISIDYRSINFCEEVIWIPNKHEVYDFNIHIEDRLHTGDLVLLVDYRTQLFSNQEIKSFISSMLAMLENILTKPKQKVMEISALSNEEKKLQFEDFNKTNLAIPSLNRLAHQVVEDQARKRPDAIAVVCGMESITYRELNEQANRLAHWLRSQGFGREDLAAILAERGIEMVIGILAVLKSGGAYAPLDSAHPDDRICTILEESNARIVLTEERWQSRSLELSKRVSQDAVVFSLDTGGSYMGL